MRCQLVLGVCDLGIEAVGLGLIEGDLRLQQIDLRLVLCYLLLVVLGLRVQRVGLGLLLGLLALEGVDLIVELVSVNGAPGSK